LTNKERYRELCKREATIPIFSKSWWLDSVAGKNWDVVLVEKKGEIQAALPFTVRQKFGLKIIGQPMLTQTLGPWLRSSSAKYAKQLSREKSLLQELFNKLPEYARYCQSWHHNRTNWLPLYWKGYEQNTRYTYRIEELENIDMLWANFQENIRREIRKAADKEGITVRDDVDLESFLALNEKVFERQNMEVPYTRDLVRSLDKAAASNHARKIFVAEDEQGRQHAGLYLIWDDNSAYYLMGGGDPLLRSSGATSLCMWEAIKFAATVTKSFDFEGSMLEPVERFFRSFGAIQTPYFQVSKTKSKLVKSYLFLKDMKS
tara:strand:+ start:16029 stop:16982 length:954 start_codon:yes stop_codon:yes gene_type:complete